MSKLSFASLTHLYSEIDDQCDTGLHSLKALSNVMRRLVIAQEEYGRSINKIIEQELNKTETTSSIKQTFNQSSKSSKFNIADDAAQSTLHGVKQMLDLYKQTAQQSINQSIEIQSKVCVPLHEMSITYQSRLTDLRREQKRVEKDMATCHSEVQNELSTCTKLLTQIEQSNNQADASPPPVQQNKSAGALFKSLQSRIESITLSTPGALTDKLISHAKKYSLAIDKANIKQTSYLSTDLPHVLTSMEQLERDRLTSINQSMTALAALHTHALPAITQSINQFPIACQQMNGAADIHTFVADLLSSHGPAPANEAYRWALPTTLDDIRAGRLTRNPLSVFHTSLSNCFGLGTTNEQGLVIPRIAGECLRGIRTHNGLQTEGIFRLSPSKAEFDVAVKQIDQGDYSILAKTTDPHLFASLFKYWLRSLSEPLINQSVYQTAIDIAQNSLASQKLDSSLALPVFEACDQQTQTVLLAIGRLVGEAQQTVTQSKMSYDAFSIVFAPCLLRCQSTDPAVIFGNTRFETRFTRLLLEAISKK